MAFPLLGPRRLVSRKQAPMLPMTRLSLSLQRIANIPIL